MGCGRIGSEVASRLWQEGNTVTVLDLELENFFRLPTGLRDTEGATLVGDGTLQDILKVAGVDQADVFVAVDVRDSRNALAAQKAKYIFHVPRVVCRIGDPVRQQMYRELGLTAVSPTQLTSNLIMEAIQP